jgi:putative spermidine/putrescine transport system ATP-binding protein
VYEQPKTSFVAGFVGTSNLIDGEAARKIIGSDGRYAVRPEKIRLVAPDTAVAADQYSTTGTVRDVVYLGAQMRLLVSVDGGAELVVSEQSLTSAAEAVAQRGREVRLVWQKQHTLALGNETSEVAERRTDR